MPFVAVTATAAATRPWPDPIPRDTSTLRPPWPLTATTTGCPLPFSPLCPRFIHLPISPNPHQGAIVYLTNCSVMGLAGQRSWLDLVRKGPLCWCCPWCNQNTAETHRVLPAWIFLKSYASLIETCKRPRWIAKLLHSLFLPLWRPEKTFSSESRRRVPSELCRLVPNVSEFDWSFSSLVACGWLAGKVSKKFCVCLVPWWPCWWR